MLSMMRCIRGWSRWNAKDDEIERDGKGELKLRKRQRETLKRNEGEQCGGNWEEELESLHFKRYGG